MGTLAPHEITKLLSHFTTPDQRSRRDNLRKLKDIIATLPAPVKNQDEMSPAAETTTPEAPTSVSKSSSIPPLLREEDSTDFSITSNVASKTRGRSTRSRSRTARPPSSTANSISTSISTSMIAPAIPESLLSVPGRNDTRDASPSQARESEPAAGSAVVRPGNESPASDDRISPESESRVGRISERNLGVMEIKKDKGKGNEPEGCGGLSVVQETDPHKDLHGISLESPTVHWSSLGRRPDVNIEPSHSKETESSIQNLETGSLAGFTFAESSSSSAARVFGQHIDINPTDMTGKWKPDPLHFEESDDDDDLDEWMVDRPDFDFDDDECPVPVGSLLEREDNIDPLRDEELAEFRKAWISVMKAYRVNLERGISEEETGNRLYRGEILVQD